MSRHDVELVDQDKGWCGELFQFDERVARKDRGSEDARRYVWCDVLHGEVEDHCARCSCVCTLHWHLLTRGGV